MSVCDDDEPFSSIVYKKISKRNNYDSEVLIESNGISSLKSEANYVSFGARIVLICLIVFIIVASITITMTAWPNQYDPNPSCYVDSELESFNKIVINVSKLANYSEANFIIGFGFPPHEAGFQDLINGSADTLYITIIRQNHSIESFLEEVYRTAEVIQKGLKCGKISTNFTITDGMEENPLSIDEHHVELLLNNSEIRSFHPEHQHFFNYAAKIKSVVLKHRLGASDCHSSFQDSWFVLDETQPENKSDECSKYKPADIVIITVDDASLLQNKSLPNILHCPLDGHNYNFALGHDSTIYEGEGNMLGYRCGTKFNILKIKYFKSTFKMNDFPTAKNTYDNAFEFLNRGINCGKISKNFTFIIKCQNNCQHVRCSNDTLMDWHREFYKFKTTEWLRQRTICNFSEEKHWPTETEHLEANTEPEPHSPSTENSIEIVDDSVIQTQRTNAEQELRSFHELMKPPISWEYDEHDILYDYEE